MRVFPASQYRAPLFSRVALVTTVPAGAAVLAFVAAVEARGVTRYALVAVALIVTVAGVRWAWRAASREIERLS